MLKSVTLQVTVSETADEVGSFDLIHKKSSWHWAPAHKLDLVRFCNKRNWKFDLIARNQLWSWGHELAKLWCIHT
jgi:hypothetical protein